MNAAKFGLFAVVSSSMLAAVSGADAETAPEGKRIAVAAFDAPDSPRARNEVLETLSEHSEVEVIALEDIAFEANRLKVDPMQPEGRQRLSDELGIVAWLDGKVEQKSARFTLRTPEGELIASTSLSGENVNIMAGLAGTKIWRAMGPWLSDQELHKRRVETQEDLAKEKIQARERELGRQRQVVRDRAAARVKALRSAIALARQKREAYVAELERHKHLAAERLAEADRGRLENERRQKEEERYKQQQEEAEFMASLHESGGPPPPRPETAPAATTSIWGGGNADVGGGGGEDAIAAKNVGTTASAQNPWSASASTSSRSGPTERAPFARSAPAAPAPAASARTNTAATSPWLIAAGGHAAPAASESPSQARVSPSAPAASTAAPANGDGLSPATRRWLEQQQAR